MFEFSVSHLRPDWCQDRQQLALKPPMYCEWFGRGSTSEVQSFASYDLFISIQTLTFILHVEFLKLKDTPIDRLLTLFLTVH